MSRFRNYRMTRSQWLGQFFGLPDLLSGNPKSKKNRPKKITWVIDDEGRLTKILAPTKSGARWKYKAQHGLRKFPPLAKVYEAGSAA